MNNPYVHIIISNSINIIISMVISTTMSSNNINKYTHMISKGSKNNIINEQTDRHINVYIYN